MNRPKSEKEKGQQDLEPNHTHFLLLDDGTYSGYAIGDYRTRFVIEASRYRNKDGIILRLFFFLLFFILCLLKCQSSLSLSKVVQILYQRFVEIFMHIYQSY